MESRKIQLTGGSTYTVSLPKEWASANGLDAGTEVDLYPHVDGSIVVRASESQNGDSTRIRIAVDRLSDDQLARAVQAGYVSGYDVIVLERVDGDRRREMRAIASSMIGLEIVEESESRFVLRVLLDSDDVSIRQTLVQLQFAALSMHREATAALLAADEERAAQVVERDDEPDRLFGMIGRHFQRSLTNLAEMDALGVDRPTLFDYHTTARQLERVADHAEKVARVATRLDGPPSAVGDDIEGGADAARRIVEDATNAVLDAADRDDAYRALEARDALTDDLASLSRAVYEGEATDQHSLALVVDSLIRTAEYGGNVAETAIRAAARSGEL